MTAKRKQIAWLIAGFTLGLLLMGMLRLTATYPNTFPPLAAFATPGYILITILFTLLLVRAGLPLNQFGFGTYLNGRHIMLAIAAIAVLRALAFGLDPLMEELMTGPRNLERFSDVEGSAASLVALLFMNWTFAAFGEELAYRIVLMRGIAFALGDTDKAQFAALVLQAVLFGLVHAYQGPTGIASSTLNALVFGAVTIASRWSIWPAALAHGTNNTIGIVAIYLG